MTEDLISRRTVLAGATAIALASAIALPGAAVAADYAGKTINFVTYDVPGSPPDIWTRTLIPFLEKHIAGNPKFEVINKPGAGAMISANYIASALPNDGMNIGAINAVALDRIAQGDTNTNFDLSKMAIIGAQKKTRMVAAKKEGVSGIDDLLAMDGEFIVGMQSNAASYFDAFYEMTGIQGRNITSYQSFPNALQAFRSGEVDAMSFSVMEWLVFGPDLAKDGAVPIWQYGYGQGDGTVVATDAVDVPTAQEIVRKVNPDAVGSDAWNIMLVNSTEQSVSTQIWAPEGTPEEYLELLAYGFAAANADPEYQAIHEKQYGLQPEWNTRAEARAVVDRVQALYGN